MLEPRPIRAIVCAAACVLLAGFPLAAQNGVVARASSVSGPALLYSRGSAAFTLTPGFVLNPGDRVDTRGGGRVVIDLSDGSVVIVQPETVLSIKDYRLAESLRELFEITIGMVRVKINHFTGKPNPYRMNSPTASIAVRGTEFDVSVDGEGATRVEVLEGAVEVTRLDDPGSSALIEGGRGVLVRPGQDLFLYNAPSLGRGAPARGVRMAARTDPRAPVAVDRQPPRVDVHSSGPRDRKVPLAAIAPSAEQVRVVVIRPVEPGAFDRYVASLLDTGVVPYQQRFQAFAEPFSDAQENPAAAMAFRRGEGRLLLSPGTVGSIGAQPTTSFLSPQASFFTPVGPLVAGFTHSTSRIGSSGMLSENSSNFAASTVTLAGRMNASSSWGVSFERLRGSGSQASNDLFQTFEASSTVRQARVSVGFERNLGAGKRLGVFARGGSLAAWDSGQDSRSRLWGRTAEIGMRLTGHFTPRIAYSTSVSSLRFGGRSIEPGCDESAVNMNRAVGTFGLAYRADDKTWLSMDVAAAASRLSAPVRSYPAGWTRAVSFHGAVQRDVWRGLFVSASLLGIGGQSYWQANRYAEAGAGYRINRALAVQYIRSTDYGYTAGGHSVTLRYNFRLGE